MFVGLGLIFLLSSKRCNFLSSTQAQLNAKPKETILERADFTLQLLLLVETKVYTLLPVSVSCCHRDIKLRWAERVQSMRAFTNRPRSQLFLI